ncbi:hypothetical protein ABZP36_007204 [Zizania latifolia]
MQCKQPHKWKAEETTHFLEAAVELVDRGYLFPHKLRHYSCNLIHRNMVEKGSLEISIDVMLSKFSTFLADWRGYNELKLRTGSCFNPMTATFDAPQDWWDGLRKKLKKFQKGIPHMEELDKIFRHMKSPSLCYKYGSNSHSSSTRKTDPGYHHSEPSQQLSLSRGLPGYLDLLDELEQGGVNPNCQDYITAVNLLRCPNLRTVYSRRASIDEKVAMLRELQEQKPRRARSLLSSIPDALILQHTRPMLWRLDIQSSPPATRADGNLGEATRRPPTVRLQVPTAGPSTADGEKVGRNPSSSTADERCPNLRIVYSMRASIEEKVSMLRELREQAGRSMLKLEYGAPDCSHLSSATEKFGKE